MTEAARAAADAARTTAPHAVRLAGVTKDYGPVRKAERLARASEALATLRLDG
ncbi:hypothetical protein ACWC2K_34025 [Streptomyces chattanoogensis]